MNIVRILGPGCRSRYAAGTEPRRSGTNRFREGAGTSSCTWTNGAGRSWHSVGATGDRVASRPQCCPRRGMGIAAGYESTW